jgi:exosortase/archaeosortase family protein
LTIAEDVNSLKEQFQVYLGKESTNRDVFLFLGKLILIFLAINYFFIGYTGLTVPGGKFYNSFFAEHADFISAFRRFLLWGGAKFATFIGYPSGYTDYTMFIHGGTGVRMVYSCMGFGVMSAYAALILAWPAPWLNRLMSLLAGLSLIVLINMIRIGGLAVLYATRRNDVFGFINHHDVFNVVVVVIIFLFFTFHIRMATRRGIERSEK